MSRSTTSRNFAGGFIGGFIGIITCWYISPAILPIGVLGGVITGWWIEDIVKVFAYSTENAYTVWQSIQNWFESKGLSFQRLSVLTRRLREQTINFFSKTKELLKVGYILVSLFKRFGNFFIKNSRKLGEWVSHPSSKALLLTYLAGIALTALTAVSIYLLIPWPETYVAGKTVGTAGEIRPFGLGQIIPIVFIATLFLTVFSIAGTAGVRDRESKIGNFYQRWERYSNQSSIKYFLGEFAFMLKMEVVVALFFAISMLYWITLGGLIIAVVVIPIATLISFAIGILRITQRAGHWLCVGVTLVTTTILAIVFYNSFQSEIIVWITALSAGIISGALTEGIRRFSEWWSSTLYGRYYLRVWNSFDSFLPVEIGRPSFRVLQKGQEKMASLTSFIR